MSEPGDPLMDHRRQDTELGFTLVELLITVVILGLVVGPLGIGLVQALRVIPDSGERTQAATDRDRALLVFADDVAQAQNTAVNQPGLPAGTPFVCPTAPSSQFDDI